uniref:Ribosomal RNA small subunit methyltransferase I n=1 Tax=candidate division CPR3 bacterium TaxID=2268181 RepID=A0A7C4R6N3_UNCC3
MSKLYIVGTPIGNLEDLTFRAFNTLRKVDFVLAEDTRKTKILLDRYDIEKPIISYHQHSKITKVEKIIELLKEGKELALVTDAGTPGISDPGNELVERILIHNKATRPLQNWRAGRSMEPTFEIIPIPGVSAVTTILSVCGFPTDDFLFLGFLPKKKGKETLLKSLANQKRTVVFFESPHRIVKILQNIMGHLGDIEVVVGRELTKKFEEVLRGKISEVVGELSSRSSIKGEIVVVLGKKIKN